MMQHGLLRVLLVDDEESYVKVVALGLKEEFDYDVAFATNGREAIDFLKSSRQGFDVMVLDYKMPEVNGLDVLRWMHEERNETPTVMLTAAGSESIAVESMKLGAYDYCRKEDTDIERLANIIKATHERHMFRVAKAIEEERAREMVLNKEATDKVRDVINAITPTLNSAFASISADFETKGEQILQKLPAEDRRELGKMINNIQDQVAKLEAGIRGLLAIYQLTYARYPEAKELDRIRTEFEERTKQLAAPSTSH
jgi:DNA-binding response OmpR family regulator